MFLPGALGTWDAYKVTASQVLQQGAWFVMFYIGFSDINHAQIGLARSADGVTGCASRYAENPVIRPGSWGEWDQDAVYRPAAMLVDGRWLLWYNGRSGGVEQIGLAVHEGSDLGFTPLAALSGGSAR